ncbi:MAG: 1-phosphofructokinase family hexose kinase [Ancalomicrobiaceae bacterium]|nr:1-phosphofructokinase family hexose kinase [Ancalomicrobiaceae bacterium]
MASNPKRGRAHASIVTLTLNPSIDLFCETDRVQPTHKMRTYGEHMDAGGGGVNVARVIRELGGDVLAICFAGGATGGLLGELLAREDIPYFHVPIANPTRINHVVRERQTGEEYRFVLNGPEVSSSEKAALLRAVHAIDFEYFVASGSLPPSCPADLLIAIAEISRARGAHFVLDSSGDGLEKTLEAGGVFLVKPSIGELEKLVGRPLPTEEEQHVAAMKLIKDGHAEFVAVTLGGDGAFLASKKGVQRLAPPPVQAISTVGAGDSFLAGLVLSLAHGDSELDALAHGIASGTAAVLERGTSLCRAEDVDRLYGILANELGDATKVAVKA